MDAPSPVPGTSTHISTTPPSSQQSSVPNFSRGLHKRPRRTIACAECKRFKLQCNRRNPCGSCIKRDTVQRCQYIAATADVIDDSPSSQQSSIPNSSSGLHSHSRITIACAECKRLKLRCDRRNPCSRCIRRDTVQLCQYTAAAAAANDAELLHNQLRVSQFRLLLTLVAVASHLRPKRAR